MYRNNNTESKALGGQVPHHVRLDNKLVEGTIVKPGWTWQMRLEYFTVHVDLKGYLAMKVSVEHN